MQYTKDLIEKIAQIHSKKAHDYAADDNEFSNFEIAASYAGITVLQQFDALIGTKLARLKELLRSGKTPNNESILDTKLDLLIYRVLRLAYEMKLGIFDEK